MTIYLDTSALVKLIEAEPETDDLLSYLAQNSDYVTSAFGQVELMRVGHRNGPDHVARAVAILDRIPIIGLGPSVLRAACNLLPGSFLRTLDAIHLAPASAIPDLTFVCTYDERMISSGRALGMHCVTPGSTP